MVRSRPPVTVKWAQTLDGRIATSSGHSRWVSSPDSRALAHRLRAEHAAVLVGIGTLLADDPQLNVRLVEGPDPVRVVLDSRLRIPGGARVLASGGETLVLTTDAADPARINEIEASGGRVVKVAASPEGVDLAAALEALGNLGLGPVLVEGGSGVITSLLRARLVDRVVAIVAPKLVGDGIDAVGDLATGEMSGAIELDRVSVSRSGQDIVIDGVPVWPSE